MTKPVVILSALVLIFALIAGVFVYKHYEREQLVYDTEQSSRALDSLTQRTKLLEDSISRIDVKIVEVEKTRIEYQVRIDTIRVIDEIPALEDALNVIINTPIK